MTADNDEAASIVSLAFVLRAWRRRRVLACPASWLAMKKRRLWPYIKKILQFGSPAFYLNAFFDRYTCVFLDPRRREIDSRTPAPQTAYPVITASQKQHKGGP
jgi:hypothetical protein